MFRNVPECSMFRILSTACQTSQIANTVEPCGTPPYSFKPNVTIIESFYYFEDPVNATTSVLRPGFYGPMVVALTGFHCKKSEQWQFSKHVLISRYFFMWG